MKYMGLDFGSKKVGVALSDEAASMAFSKAVIPNDEHLEKAVVDLCREEDVAGIILGESKDSDMNDNPIMEAVRAFVAKLKGNDYIKEKGIDVSFEPEFMTSVQARNLHDTLGGERGKGDMVDATAAAIILQTFLDRRANNNA